LFRDVEEKVVGRGAAVVRQNARARATEEKTGQLDLGIVPAIDIRYRRLRDTDIDTAHVELMARLRQEGAIPFGKLWPSLLAELHVTRKDVADLVAQLAGSGVVAVRGMTSRERSIKDQHVVAMP
jgi:hypothetical protein